MLATGDRVVRFHTGFSDGGDQYQAITPTTAAKTVTAPSVPRLDLPLFPDVRVAENLTELLAAFRLVYRKYAERGLVEKRATGVIYSSEFAQGDSRTLVALGATGEVTATATFIAEPSDPGAEDVIPWRLIQSYDPDRRLAGVTCLASLGLESGPSPAAFFSLARFLFQYAKYRGYDGLAITIHPRQLRFYKRICPIVPLSPVYRQEKLGDALAVACRIDLDALSLSGVHPAVLGWFESPISEMEFNRPGIGDVDDLVLSGLASRSGNPGASDASGRAACA